MDDIERLRWLAGIKNKPMMTEYKGYSKVELESYGETISQAASEKRKIEKERGIKPGDQEWFKLYFSLPYWIDNKGK